jgi:hypothetical protein
VGSFDKAHDFARLLRQEAIRRGVGKAQQVVFLSDGAAWTEQLQRQNLAEAVSILDFYHAAERVHILAKSIDPEEVAAKKRARLWTKNLLRDKVSEVINQARMLLPRNRDKRKPALEQIKFMAAHQNRMLYGTYRMNGWFIGSGVIDLSGWIIFLPSSRVRQDEPVPHRWEFLFAHQPADGPLPAVSGAADEDGPGCVRNNA